MAKTARRGKIQWLRLPAGAGAAGEIGFEW
jgi:hypothetical protein